MPRTTWDKLDATRRERVLLAAMEEFGQHGYSGGSLNVIARVADVSKGSLFQYFHDKFDLFAYVAEESSTRVFEAMRPYLQAPIPEDVVFLDHVAALVERWIAYMAANPLDRSVTAATSMELDPHVRRAVRSPVHRLFALGLRPLFEHAVHEGHLRPDTDVDALLALSALLLPHLALAPFEPGLDVAVPLHGTSRSVRVAHTRRLVDAVFAGSLADRRHATAGR